MFNGFEKMKDEFSRGFIRDLGKPDFKQDGFPEQFPELRFSPEADKQFPYTRKDREKIRENGFEKQ